MNEETKQTYINFLLSYNAELKQQNADLLAALEVYANEDNWRTEAVAHDMETGEFPNVDGATPTVDMHLDIGIPIVWNWDDEGYQLAKQALAAAKGGE